jgi:hypothetical protein
MAGWWSELGLRALLERHREELAAVWPAVRDRTLPPTPSPSSSGSYGTRPPPGATPPAPRPSTRWPS